MRMLSEQIYRPANEETEAEPIAVIAHVRGTCNDAITLEFDDYQITLSVGAAASLASTIREATSAFLLHHNGTATKEN
jgi:hydrogenase maturation factor HypF (carbamoyltransferase family)